MAGQSPAPLEPTSFAPARQVGFMGPNTARRSTQTTGSATGIIT
ncbi:hypothetical protein [Flavimaricola marinus]|nr:hypothetical protein [Flavimaricola marinus]